MLCGGVGGWGGRRAFQWSGTIYRLDSGRHSQRSARVVGYHLKPEPDPKARQGAAPQSRGQGWAGVRVLWRVAGLVLAVVVVCVAKGTARHPKIKARSTHLQQQGRTKRACCPSQSCRDPCGQEVRVMVATQNMPCKLSCGHGIQPGAIQSIQAPERRSSGERSSTHTARRTCCCANNSFAWREGDDLGCEPSSRGGKWAKVPRLLPAKKHAFPRHICPDVPHQSGGRRRSPNRWMGEREGERARRTRPSWVAQARGTVQKCARLDS